MSLEMLKADLFMHIDRDSLNAIKFQKTKGPQLPQMTLSVAGNMQVSVGR